MEYNGDEAEYMRDNFPEEEEHEGRDYNHDPEIVPCGGRLSPHERKMDQYARNQRK